MRKSFLWAIILALSAIVAGARAQRFYLPEDLSFTGSQYVWESRALFELSDPDMWLYCEAGYAPALQYLPPFSELRHLLHHPCRSYARWGYQGMIGYRVLTDYGYYFLSPLCDPIFLGYRILDDWLGRPLRILYRTYADLSYLHFRVRAFDNIWRHHRFYDYYPRYGHRHYGWYNNHHCHVRPSYPHYAPPRSNYANGRNGYVNRNPVSREHVSYRSSNATRSSSSALSSGSLTRSTTRNYSSGINSSSSRSVTRSASAVVPLTRSSSSGYSSGSYSSGRSFRSSAPSSSYRGASMGTRSSSSSSYSRGSSSGFRSGGSASFSRSSSSSYSTRSSGASFSPSRQSGYSGRGSGGSGRR